MSTSNAEEDNINIISHSHEYPDEGEKDRISRLPDSLLISIVSLLQTDSATTTSVLSTRWCYLWTHITHLSFPLPGKPKFDDLMYYVTTVNHILSQLTSTKIHTFDLYFSYRFIRNVPKTTLKLASSYLLPWIYRIYRRNSEVFKVNIQFRSDVPSILFQMPTCVFETQSLVELKLHGDNQFRYFDNDGSLLINLPNLKKLHLFLNDSHYPLMGTLFKSCPLLEDLYLCLNVSEDDYIVNISALNLKCLSLELTARSSTNCKFLIDAPKLEKFNFKGYIAFYDFLTFPSNLQDVKIDVDAQLFHADRGEVLGLIQGISCIRSLVLYCEPSLLKILSDLGSNDIPVFHNLIHLSFSGDCDEWEDPLPDYLLGNLKGLEIIKLTGVDCEIDLLRRILSSLSALVELRVSACEVPTVDQLRMEYEFCKELFMLPRASPSCQIEFSGQMVTSSSKDFRNGVLTLLVKDMAPLF